MLVLATLVVRPSTTGFRSCLADIFSYKRADKCSIRPFQVSFIISFSTPTMSIFGLLLVVAFFNVSNALLTPQQVVAKVGSQLVPKLSKEASITFEGPPRWSTFHAPDPVVVVNIVNELDVATTVSYTRPT
jgi:hypothetical protein